MSNNYAFIIEIQIQLLNKTINMENLTFNDIPEAITKLYYKLEKIENLLIDKNISIQSDEDEILNVEQCAKYISTSKSSPNIYFYYLSLKIIVNLLWELNYSVLLLYISGSLYWETLFIFSPEFTLMNI